MRLIFSKNAANEIVVQIQKGTIIAPFTYIEMVEQLLSEYNFEETIFNDLSDEEMDKVNVMLDKVRAVFEEENNTQDSEVEY